MNIQYVKKMMSITVIDLDTIAQCVNEHDKHNHI